MARRNGPTAPLAKAQHKPFLLTCTPGEAQPVARRKAFTATAPNPAQTFFPTDLHARRGAAGGQAEGVDRPAQVLLVAGGLEGQALAQRGLIHLQGEGGQQAG